jgi:hypothetical protein
MAHKNLPARVAILSAASLMLTLGAAPARADVISVQVDISSSTWVTTDPGFAAGAGRRMQERLEVLLEEGDRVELELIGDITQEGGPIRVGFDVSRSFDVRASAAYVGDAIAALPAGVESGALRPEESTNLVGAVVSTMRRLRADRPGEAVTLFIITDGVEHSGYVTGMAFLEGAVAGDMPLPEPDPALLEGVNVRMYGLGQRGSGGDVTVAEAVVRVWRAWCEAAGAADCQILSNN